MNEVWPNAELEAHAIAVGEELAAMPRLAVKSMLRCLVGNESRTLAESLRDEREAVHATFDTPDQIEGFEAFVQKREPVFNRG